MRIRRATSLSERILVVGLAIAIPVVLVSVTTVVLGRFEFAEDELYVLFVVAVATLCGAACLWLANLPRWWRVAALVSLLVVEPPALLYWSTYLTIGLKGGL